jgi:hypothetical protein
MTNVLRRLLFVVFILGLGAPLLLLSARQATPTFIGENDIRETLAVATAAVLSDRPRGEIGATFLSVDGRNPDPMIINALSSLGHRVRPVSERPKTCGAETRELTPTADCNADVLDTQLLSMPLWRTALVAARSRACRHELVLLSLPTGWWVISHRGWCS